MKTETLYFNNINYNLARILEKLRNIIGTEHIVMSEYLAQHPVIYQIHNRDDNTAPIITTHHTTYIQYVKNNVYTYFQTDSNPFFEFMYYKEPIDQNNMTHGMRYMKAISENMQQKLCCDECFTQTASEETIENIAILLANYLDTLPLSEVVTKRQRVYHGNSGSYHYENVPENPNRTHKYIYVNA